MDSVRLEICYKRQYLEQLFPILTTLVLLVYIMCLKTRMLINEFARFNESPVRGIWSVMESNF